MLTQTLLFPVLALAAFASANPIEARDRTVTATRTVTRTSTTTAIPTSTTPSDRTCPQPGSLYFVIPSKNYLYGLYCDQAFTTDGGLVINKITNNILACAVACDTFTNNTPGQICSAANFHPGTAKGKNNCELFTRGIDSETVIVSDTAKGVEAVQVTKTKVTNIQ